MLLDFYSRYTYRGTWNGNTSYAGNDMVLFGSQLLIAQEGSVGVSPDTENQSVWVDSPYNYRGEWTANPNPAYMKNNAVLRNERIYFLSSTTGNPEPGDEVTPQPWVLVQNNLGDFISGIRSLVWISLNQTSLPDTTILRSVFFTSAEREVRRELMVTDAKLADPDFREEVSLAIQYLTAAKILPSLPQMIEEQVLRERYEFAEIDWKERIDFLMKEYQDVIDVVNDSPALAIFEVAEQYVAF